MLASAKSGDAAAMRALHLHYDVAVGDAERSLYWGKRAGDAGDTESQQNVLCHLARAGLAVELSDLELKWRVKSSCSERGGT